MDKSRAGDGDGEDTLKLEDLERIQREMIPKPPVRLHAYDLLEGVSSIYGIPVHKSSMAVTTVHGWEVIPFKERWWRPWDNLRPKDYRMAGVLVMNSPDFGKRILVHPDLYDVLIKGRIDIPGIDEE